MQSTASIKNTKQNKRTPASTQRSSSANQRAPRRAPRKRAYQEFEQKVIDIRRVARVVSGGRRFSFSAVVVLGNRKGSVGVGVGKGTDTAIAIEKAVKDARKNMIEISMTKTHSIPRETSARYTSADVHIIPAPGRGLVAGSSVRTVLDMAGLTDITAKIHSRSKNRLNNAMAALNALRELKPAVTQ